MENPMKDTKKIAILTSGGDSPGMNAAIKGVVRAALNKGWEAYGIRDAYLGMVEGGDSIFPLDWIDVSWNFKEGGTFLGSARYTALKGDSKDARMLREKALMNLKELGITGLVVIGGDGSLTGAYCLYQTLTKDSHINKELDGMELSIVGMPGSIDNDIPFTSMCIGVDTTLNTIVECIDRLRDTAESHKRVIIVEVMGRRRGYLAVISGLATGADRVFIREQATNRNEINNLLAVLKEGFSHGQKSGIIVRSEGAAFSTAYLKETVDVLLVPKREVRETVLGHLQRGGTPTAFERTLSIRLGVKAVDMLEEGILEPVFLGLELSVIKAIPLARVIETLNTQSFQDELSPVTQKMFRLGQRLEEPPAEIRTAKSIAILTDGNNVSGMNMAIRTIGRLAINDGLGVKGIKGGFSGLEKGRESVMDLEWEMLEMKGILRRAGTLLGVSGDEGIDHNFDYGGISRSLEDLDIDGMVVIGNNSTYRLASRLAIEAKIPVVGIPADINCNMPGTDLVIGMDSSLNDMLGWIDKSAEAAHAKKRIFILHLKGEYCMCSVKNAALAGGVEEIIINDMESADEEWRHFQKTVGERIANIKKILDSGKVFATIIFFSKHPENADKSMNFIMEAIGREGISQMMRVVPFETSYGGITPTAFDRVLAKRFGEKALAALRKKIELNDCTFHITGITGKEIRTLPYDDHKNVVDHSCRRRFEEELESCIHIMSQQNEKCIGMGGNIKWTDVSDKEGWKGRWTCKKCGHSQDVSMIPGKMSHVHCENESCANYGYIRMSRRL
jgi:6-phosphofructokinase 1